MSCATPNSIPTPFFLIYRNPIPCSHSAKMTSRSSMEVSGNSTPSKKVGDDHFVLPRTLCPTARGGLSQLRSTRAGRDSGSRHMVSPQENTVLTATAMRTRPQRVLTRKLQEMIIVSGTTAQQRDAALANFAKYGNRMDKCISRVE